MSATGPAARLTFAAKPGSASDVASSQPPKAARRASRAWRRGALRIARNTPSARLPVCLTEARTPTPSAEPPAPRSKKRQKARLDAGLCIRCGHNPPAEGGITCAPCRDKRQAAERRQYRERRAAALCVRCGGATIDGLSRCAPCAAIEDARHSPERKNERSRKLYAERRARGLCTSCGAPSQGASRCTPCAEKSYHRSAHFKGMPVWDPTWTVIEIATGEELGTFDSVADIALCLAFAKLGRDQVEIVTDASPISSYASWT